MFRRQDRSLCEDSKRGHKPEEKVDEKRTRSKARMTGIYVLRSPIICHSKGDDSRPVLAAMSRDDEVRDNGMLSCV